MRLTEKTKRYLAVAGGIVVCVGFVIAISSQFQKAPEIDEILPKESTTAAEIIVDLEETKKETEITKESVIQTEKESSVRPDESEDPIDNRPEQTDQPEQSIQPEVTKPAAPSAEALKDPTTKPDGTKMEEPPVPVAHEEVTSPAQTEADPEVPQAGETSGSQIYVPGFGWVENHGGGTDMTTLDDMYENGNKIVIMD